MDLQILQIQLFERFGFKVDLYHDESYRGVLVVPHGAPLIRENVIYAIQY